MDWSHSRHSPICKRDSVFYLVEHIYFVCFYWGWVIFWHLSYKITRQCWFNLGTIRRFLIKRSFNLVVVFLLHVPIICLVSGLSHRKKSKNKLKENNFSKAKDDFAFDPNHCNWIVFQLNHRKWHNPHKRKITCHCYHPFTIFDDKASKFV
jgi:hypothetical protein